MELFRKVFKMSMKEDYQEAYEYLHNKELTHDDFNGKTVIYHSDSCKFVFTHSCCEQKDGFIYVWSENNGYHFWIADDIYRIKFEIWGPSMTDRIMNDIMAVMNSNHILCCDDIDKRLPPNEEDEEDEEKYTFNQFLKDCFHRL